MSSELAAPLIEVPSAPPTDAAALLARAAAAAAAAHESFLRVSRQVNALATEQVRAQMELVERLRTVAPPQAGPSIAPPVADPLFDREQCMAIATGSIASVLGAKFAAVDSHPTRVRLPDEPLMLVDRIVSIEGEPLSMSSGRIVTEHDIHSGAWYLDNERIPTCIAVEAGQADLFLSGYLGVDFETKGEAVYRLLDAVVTFHDELPGPGDTIHYEIEIKHFFRQGDTWLFRFEFEATVRGRPLMTMQEGCAGFFTQAELDAGKGIVHSRLEQRERRGVLPHDYVELVPMGPTTLDETQLSALRNGHLTTAFGPEFAGLPCRDPLSIPSGRMELVHRVTKIDPTGGRYGIGGITAEADIRPDDWFLPCHFVDDKVMPGTLMYECCLHTLRIYLLRMGWVADANDVALQPVLGVRSRLKCRGQVIDTTRVVTYEVSIKEIGYSPEPFAIVDALMSADGKPIVEISDMSTRLTGLSREKLIATWAGHRGEPHSDQALFNYDKILAFSDGRPSEAFGAPYAVFDEDRVIARLPRPPYQFLDRIVDVTGEPFVMVAPASCVAEVDIAPDHWYFASNCQDQIPFAILLEMALQPCGWLAAYVGSALTSETDLKFRNLGGAGVQHAPVVASDETLRTRVELTSVSHSGGMIIQHYSYSMVNRAGSRVYHGTTYFGFFTGESLANQVGIRDAERYLPDEAALGSPDSFPVPGSPPFPDDQMRMVHEVELYLPEGGTAGLGFIRGGIDVDSDAWFFKAHFHQDPVWPGSLGLEAFLQLLKIVAWRRFDLGPDAEFSTMPLGHRHEWTYRGQIAPTSGRVQVEANITSIETARRTLIADGFLMVDGRTVYELRNFALECPLKP